MARLASLLALLTLSTSCHPAAVPVSPDSHARRIVNLHAFGRLYGLVRWFHPSDAAATVDWDRFAVDGVRRVLDARDPRALRAALLALFQPIAPTVAIAGAGEPLPAWHPAATSNIVAWQHEGFGDSSLGNLFVSKRTHRDLVAAVAGEPFAALWQSVDATAFRGGTVRLRGALRTAHPGHAQLWLRVERPDGVGFTDNKKIASSAWRPVELAGPIAPDATRIVFGIHMQGRGASWFDDLALEVRHGGDIAWTPIDIKDAGFEDPSLAPSWRPGMGNSSVTTRDGWNLVLDPDRPASGNTALRVEAATHAVTGDLFEATPALGETADIELGEGLRARVPIALAFDPRDATHRPRPAAPPTDTFDRLVGLADVLVTWNVFQHFSPYWDIVPDQWEAELDTSLADALDDRTADDHVATMNRLSVALRDAHSSTVCDDETPRDKPPFVVQVIEGQLVVTTSAVDTILRGDVIIAIDSTPALQLLGDLKARIAGTDHWRTARASELLGAGPVGSLMTVRVRRGTAELDVTARRGPGVSERFELPPIHRFDDGVYYVALDRASLPQIEAVLDDLARAPGVVFDVRDRPLGNHQILANLATKSIDMTSWFTVPYIIRPDHAPNAIVQWKALSRPPPLAPREPHIRGRVAFLTGPGANSYAESVMSVVEAYHLGAIVGATTAGANGNKAEITEPSGCRVTFTGVRATKPDGSRFHLIGVPPTIPAARTIDGVRSGRDEMLEAGLVYVRTPPG